jgi:protoporphyrinogen oxidase
MNRDDIVILGGGITGLAAGLASGAQIYEAGPRAGGLCASYYLAPGELRRQVQPPPGGNAYRFEIGGGHWIWGCEGLIGRFVSSLVSLQSYTRKAGVYLAGTEQIVPFPIQYHLSALGSEVAGRALAEIAEGAARPSQSGSMRAWFRCRFGPTLDELFFASFQSLYTAGLWETIAPEDGDKSPLDLPRVIGGALGFSPSAGYNAGFVYPQEGLGALAEQMAQRCRVSCNKQVVGIEVADHILRFADGSSRNYGVLISTLPLFRILEMAGVGVAAPPDPYVSVLVLNVGGRRGTNCPEEHWLYIGGAHSGFHRVGFYSNIDRGFLPQSLRHSPQAVSLYVEKAFPGGAKPSPRQMDRHAAQIISELQAWGWLDAVDVADLTWIEVAYTWRAPQSRWPKLALEALEQQGIYSIGRYGRWATGLLQQGLAQALEMGFQAGATFR